MVKTPKTPRRARGEFLARFKAKRRRSFLAKWAREHGQNIKKICKEVARSIRIFRKTVRGVSIVAAPANRDGIGIHADPNEGEGPAGCAGPFYVPLGVDITSVFKRREAER